MMTLRDLQKENQKDPAHKIIHLMDFVDDFRHFKNPSAIARPFRSENFLSRA